MKTWDEQKINRASNKFDVRMYEERRAYLIAMDDIAAAKLSTDEQYDRIRFLREKEGYLRHKSLIANIVKKEVTEQPRQYNKPSKVIYNNGW